MDLFDDRDPEEFLLFVQNFQMNFETLGTLSDSGNTQFLYVLLCGKVLSQLGTLSIDVGSMTISHLNCIILCLGT